MAEACSMIVWPPHVAHYPLTRLGKGWLLYTNDRNSTTRSLTFFDPTESED